MTAVPRLPACHVHTTHQLLVLLAQACWTMSLFTHATSSGTISSMFMHDMLTGARPFHCSCTMQNQALCHLIAHAQCAHLRQKDAAVMRQRACSMQVQAIHILSFLVAQCYRLQACMHSWHLTLCAVCVALHLDVHQIWWMWRWHACCKTAISRMTATQMRGPKANIAVQVSSVCNLHRSLRGGSQHSGVRRPDQVLPAE